jgi:hypothetical protein
LNRLTRSAIQSGVFTSVLAILALVCFSALSDTLFYVTFGIPCARGYTIVGAWSAEALAETC